MKIEAAKSWLFLAKKQGFRKKHSFRKYINKCRETQPTNHPTKKLYEFYVEKDIEQ